MSYLKKIEINGFKTFSEKTTLLLDKGFTTITGPNGSGKTNIIDAVLFGLGELSARRLRAENFSSLIFHGGSNPSIKKKIQAKVVIQFDNSDSRIPVETSTVTISREIDQHGQSIYRLNGRRTLRSHVMDVFSMVGISSYGQNIVLQGALTRMAEVSPKERGKIIEGMIGIAQYDAEKAEAEEKLKSAEISIQTALGQVGEVQKRVEDLERERNDLLRYNFIQNEIKRLEAVRISQEVRDIDKRANDLSSRIKELEEKIEKIRERGEYFRSKRHEIEAEWRKLGFEELEEGQTQILEIQIQIGDFKSRLSELSAKINSGKTSLQALGRVKENTKQQIESIKNGIKESKLRIRKLTVERNKILNEIAEKQSKYDSIIGEIAQFRSRLDEKSSGIREVDGQIDKLYGEMINLRSSHARSQSRITVYSQRLRDLILKKDDLKSSLERLQGSLKGLQDIRKEQRDRLEAFQRTLNKRSSQRESVEKEIKEAGRIAETAREAFVEFTAQKELIEKVKTEENALRNIKELGELGIIPGIYGSLRDLIKINKKYEQAVEAAAAGWLNSIVVEDFDAAFTCTETLRRSKLGRVKIIPIQGLTPPNQVDPPKIKGMEGRILDFIKYAEKYQPALSFVFGDTLLASDEKVALSASREGFRSVTIDGDLYEAGGGVESGFYRTPIDFSSIVPSKSALESLEQAVENLENNLKKRAGDIEEFEKEILETHVEITRLTETTEKLEGEIERVRKSIQRTNRNIKRAERNIEKIQGLLEKEKAQIGLYEAKKSEISDKERKLRKELSNLKKGGEPSGVQEKELQKGALENEIMGLRQKVGDVETELSTLRSKLENVLNIGLENALIQFRKAEGQISSIEKEIEGSTRESGDIENKIRELEKTKESLSSSLLNAREEGKKFTSQIDDIDNQLQKIDGTYEQMDKMLGNLKLELQTLLLQMDRCRDNLKTLGYEGPLDVSSEEVREAEVSLKLMKLELERIGAVNQLAQVHYSEQVSRYKELSLRMNELEKERIAIINFIEEIEQKKYNVFMDAFNQINKNIDKYFSKLTGGGGASLKLEDTEDPFAGGVDMVVQFPNKPSILVSGASSGERSVAAVAFLFALQEFTPASFYLLDEIDAHLDAFHVERLGELLAEEAAKSQFLVVTLKPEMVSKADKIYGVYAREGASHIISTTFKGATH